VKEIVVVGVGFTTFVPEHRGDLVFDDVLSHSIPVVSFGKSPQLTILRLMVILKFDTLCTSRRSHIVYKFLLSYFLSRTSEGH